MSYNCKAIIEINKLKRESSLIESIAMKFAIYAILQIYALQVFYSCAGHIVRNLHEYLIFFHHTMSHSLTNEMHQQVLLCNHFENIQRDKTISDIKTEMREYKI